MVPIVLTLKSSTYYTPISLTKFWSPVQAMVKIITFTVTQKKNDKSKIKQFYLYGTCKLAIPICLGFQVTDSFTTTEKVYNEIES